MKSPALVCSLLICAALSSARTEQAATLTHRYEFDGNVNDSKGTLNGTPTTNLDNENFKLEAPGYVNDAPDHASGSARSIELGIKAGSVKSGFHIANEAIDRSAGSLSVWLKPAAPPSGDTSMDYVVYMPKLGDGMFVAANPVPNATLATRFGSEAGTVSVPGIVSEGTWTHVAVTWDTNSGIKFYIDGSLKGEAPLSGFTSTASIRFGNFEFSGSDFLAAQYSGLLYDLQIYRGVLSPADIGRLYKQPGEVISSKD